MNARERVNFLEEGTGESLHWRGRLLISIPVLGTWLLYLYEYLGCKRETDVYESIMEHRLKDAEWRGDAEYEKQVREELERLQSID